MHCTRGDFPYVTSFAQDAENLNLHTPRTEPYLCYGRLADGCPNAEKLGWKVGIQGCTFPKFGHILIGPVGYMACSMLLFFGY